MNAWEVKRPPGSPTGASHDLLGGKIWEHDNPALQVDSDATQRTSRPGKGGADIYRLRWWRPGWKGGRDAANSKLYSSGAAAHRRAVQMRNAPPNEHGPLHVEVSWSRRGPWVDAT